MTAAIDPTPTTEPTTRARRHRARNLVIACVLAGTMAAGGTAAWALDRFVIDHVQIADVRAYEASQAEEGSAATSLATESLGSADTSASDEAGAAVTDTSYTTDDTAISISTVVTGSGDETVTYYVADVMLDDPTDLQSAFADNSFGENIVENTSDIAADNDAVLAINGDYYGFRDSGIVIRNGVVYRDQGARQGLAIYRDGHAEIYDETVTSAADLVASGVWNTLSFGPALIADGDIVDGIDDVEIDTNFGNHSIQGDQPRTAIGIVAPGHYVFVVVDGRSVGYSAGVSVTEMAQIMVDLGATTAYNLDGGGSSTMYFGGKVVNDPLGRGEERGTSDILYVGA